MQEGAGGAPWIRVGKTSRLRASRRCLVPVSKIDRAREQVASCGDDGYGVERRFQEHLEAMEASQFFNSTLQQLRFPLKGHASGGAASTGSPERSSHAVQGPGEKGRAASALCRGKGDLRAAPMASAAVLCCYGLGCVEGGEAFLVQLCFASLLRKMLAIPTQCTWVSDPAMGTKDYALVRYAGLMPDTSGKSEEAYPMDDDQTHRAQDTENLDGYDAITGSSGSDAFFVTLSGTIKANLKACFEKKKVVTVYLLMPHCDQPVYGEVLRLLSTICRCNVCGTRVRFVSQRV